MDNAPHSAVSEVTDEDMLRHIGYCGVLVTIVALAIAWVDNTVA